MMIDSENKLLSIDESCLSELSEENESTISGGFLLGWIFGGLFGWNKPQSSGTTVINNIYVTNTSSSSSGSSSGGSGGGGGYHKP